MSHVDRATAASHLQAIRTSRPAPLPLGIATLEMELEMSTQIALKTVNAPPSVAILIRTTAGPPQILPSVRVARVGASLDGLWHSL